jgi:repressor LexA
MDGLTKRQEQILSFICDWQTKRGFAPSIREVAAHFKIQVTPAANHLRALEHKGALKRSPGKSRSLTVSEEAKLQHLGHHSSSNSFPLVGSIPAGVPLAVEEMTDELLHLTPDWFGRGQMIALKVIGDSMEGDAIRDGDLAIIKLQKQATPQDIAAVRVEGSEFTLKRVKIKGDLASLISSNPKYQVRKVAADQVEIVGVLEGIIRRHKL